MNTKSSYGLARAASASPSPSLTSSRRPAPPARSKTTSTAVKQSKNTVNNLDNMDLNDLDDEMEDSVYARSTKEALIAALRRIKLEHAEVCQLAKD